MNRKYEFPEEVKKNNFQFGQKIGGCKYNIFIFTITNFL